MDNYLLKLNLAGNNLKIDAIQVLANYIMESK